MHVYLLILSASIVWLFLLMPSSSLSAPIERATQSRESLASSRRAGARVRRPGVSRPSCDQIQLNPPPARVLLFAPPLCQEWTPCMSWHSIPHTTIIHVTCESTQLKCMWSAWCPRISKRSSYPKWDPNIRSSHTRKHKQKGDVEMPGSSYRTLDSPR